VADQALARRATCRADVAIGFSPVVVLFGNLLDGLFTLTLLQLRVVHEANPFMRWMYQASPLSFMTVKLAIVQLGMVVLCLQRGNRASQLAINAGAALYAAIVCYHLTVIAWLPV
jgi:Domain of unknown function (DUF5658)